MSTIILTDSRLKALKKDSEIVKNCVLHIRPGSKMQDHVQFVKRHERRFHELNDKLYIVCLGINNIRDDIYDCSSTERDDHRREIIGHFRSLIKAIFKYNPRNSVVIATIPPKDLLKSISKYPTKSRLQLKSVTQNHQFAFETFICGINKDIDELNKAQTGEHLALHTDLRTLRGSRSTYKRQPKNKTGNFRYHKLFDGLHPHMDLVEYWKNKIEDLRKRLCKQY